VELSERNLRCGGLPDRPMERTQTLSEITIDCAKRFFKVGEILWGEKRPKGFIEKGRWSLRQRFGIK
jgi:hypothetical protein